MHRRQELQAEMETVREPATCDCQRDREAAPRGLGLLLPARLSATAARMRSFNAASLILSPSCRSMARRTFPSRLELNRPAGSCSAAPFAKVILTTLL